MSLKRSLIRVSSKHSEKIIAVASGFVLFLSLSLALSYFSRLSFWTSLLVITMITLLIPAYMYRDTIKLFFGHQKQKIDHFRSRRADKKALHQSEKDDFNDAEPAESEPPGVADRHEDNTEPITPQQAPVQAQSANSDVTNVIDKHELDGTIEESEDRPLSEDDPKKKGIYRNIVHEDNKSFLTVTKIFRSKPARGKKQWLKNEFLLEISNHPLVNQRHIEKNIFLPVPTETKLLVYTRLHWFSHAPLQFLVAFATVLLMAVEVFFGFNWVSVPITFAVGALAYIAVWLPWASTYLIVTNKRILLVFKPPWPFPTRSEKAPLRKLQNGNMFNSTLGRTARYGKYYDETMAEETDKWLKQGVNYIPRSEDFEQIMSTLTTGKRKD